MVQFELLIVVAGGGTQQESRRKCHSNFALEGWKINVSI